MCPFIVDFIFILIPTRAPRVMHHTFWKSRFRMAGVDSWCGLVLYWLLKMQAEKEFLEDKVFFIGTFSAECKIKE